ncbi:MAG: hypothetical protein ACRBFS_15620 [Aureispira sp.]
MKHLFIVLMWLAACSTSYAQATASTNQTISVGAIASLQLDLRSESIEIRTTKGSRVIIESHITLENINNNSMLEYLIKAGRYELITNMDASSKSLTVQRKVNSNVILVKGQECTENIRYVVLVPDSIKTVKENGATTPVE